MYDAWTMVGVGGGSAALSWLAAGRETNGENTLRLSLDKSGSLLGDVRLLGGALTWIASMYTTGQTKKAMQTVSAAAFFSLLQTELIRMRLAKQGQVRIAQKLPLAPGVSFGALPGPNAAAQNQHAYAPQGAWAGR